MIPHPRGRCLRLCGGSAPRAPPMAGTRDYFPSRHGFGQEPIEHCPDCRAHGRLARKGPGLASTRPTPHILSNGVELHGSAVWTTRMRVTPEVRAPFVLVVALCFPLPPARDKVLRHTFVLLAAC